MQLRPAQYVWASLVQCQACLTEQLLTACSRNSEAQTALTRITSGHCYHTGGLVSASTCALLYCCMAKAM